MAWSCFSKQMPTLTLWITFPILTVSAVMLVVFPVIFDSILNREVTLQEGTLATQLLRDVPLPIYEKLYFFNITNKQEFLRGEGPLNVSEVGPYTYEVKFVRSNLKWNSNNTMSFSETKVFRFVPHLSSGSDDDVIHTLNGPLIIASRLSKDFNAAIKNLLLSLVSFVGEEIVIERSIKQLAHDGYKDKIIQLAPTFITDLPYKDGTFCWLQFVNTTNEELFTVFTGADDPAKTGLINKWNGQSKLNYWNADTCNMINGTNTILGPPVRCYGNSYTVYQKVLCRSLTLSYVEDKTHFGVQAKRFVLTHSAFANSTENPDNYCFEVNGERSSGVLDISSCNFGAPLFLSNPHFYMADPSYLGNINGLRPSQADHGSHIDVEMVSGFSIDGKIRFQFSLEISKAGEIFETYNVTDGIYPLFWAELSLEVDEPCASYIKRKTRDPKIIAYSVFGAAIIVGSILLVICSVILYTESSEGKTHQYLLGNVAKEHAKMQKSNYTSVNKNLTSEESYNASNVY